MILLKKAVDISNFLAEQKKQGQKIGFVPTMGALHAGHTSLIKNSKKQNAVTVCSIFINPTQFNDAADFEKYPVTLENDIYLLEKEKCDILFLPSVNEIYPDGFKQKTHYAIGYLETVLEGKYRPGHFQGVCQVMNRLLDIVQTDNLYLGQKDYQQCLVLKKLIEQLQLPVNITICPTQREPSGLATSSRNMRLGEKEKQQAAKIYEALNLIKKGLKPGLLQDIKNNAAIFLSNAGFKVDYIETADAATLDIITDWDGKMPLIALCAAFLNEVRLIDNLILNQP